MLREWILLVVFTLQNALVKKVLPLCSQISLDTMIFIVSLVYTGILVVLHYIQSLYGMARIVTGRKHHAVHQVDFLGFTSLYRLLPVMILSLEFVVQAAKMMKMSLLMKLSFMSNSLKHACCRSAAIMLPLIIINSLIMMKRRGSGR